MSGEVLAKVRAKDVRRAVVLGWTLERLAVERGATLAEAKMEADDLGVTLARAWPRTKPERAEMRVACCVHYKEGTSHREAAARAGLSPSTALDAWRSLFGQCPTPPGGTHSNVRNALSRRAAKRRALILRRLRKLPTSTMSIRQLAAEVSADKATVTKIVREHGLPVRDHAPFTARIIDALEDARCLTDKQIAEAIGCARQTVLAVRLTLGLKPGRARREALRSDPAPAAKP